MLVSHRLVLAPLLALGLGCAAGAPTPPARPLPPSTAPRVTQAPAVPPGHRSRADVDRVLVTGGVPWVVRQVLYEEVIDRDGKFVGWRLLGVPEEWSDIDIKPGDVVTRVNGLPVERPEQAFDALKSVARSPEMKIALMRDGTARQVIIPIDGAPSPETAKMLDQEPGQRRAAAPGPERRSIPLGGSSSEVAGDDVY